MKSGTYLVGSVLLASALCGGLALTTSPAAAQEIRDLRIDPHPVGKQVGMVTSVSGKTAWIKMPHRVREGVKVEILDFSDGGDTMATGRVQWVTPIPPYEAYVTNIAAATVSYPINPYNDLFVIGALPGGEAELHPRPDSDAAGVYIAIGFFVRAPVEPTPLDTDGVEPVRAHIQALRALKNKTANDIAAAAERALTVDPMLDPDIPPEEAVNYTDLTGNLRHFSRLSITDPITRKLLHRLLDLAAENGSPGAAVPTDFLRPSPAPNNPNQQRPY